VTIVDARGMRCPWPALRAARALRDHAEVEVIADDPAAARELAALARERGIAFAQYEGQPPRFVLGLVVSSTPS
jgi:tRNA 2-thiouridine synthesizing protein A